MLQHNPILAQKEVAINWQTIFFPPYFFFQTWSIFFTFLKEMCMHKPCSTPTRAFAFWRWLIISGTVTEKCRSQPDAFHPCGHIADELLHSWHKATALPPMGSGGLWRVSFARAELPAGGGSGSWYNKADLGHGSLLPEKVLPWRLRREAALSPSTLNSLPTN